MSTRRPLGDRARLVVLLEAERSRLLAELAEVRTTLWELQAARSRLSQQLAAAEAECERLAVEHVTTARQASELANLYVASRQLHVGLEPADVLRAIQEIVVGLIGCEQFAVFQLDRGGRRLERIWRLGIEERRLASLTLEQGAIGRVVASGECFFVADRRHGALTSEEAALSACVPLRVGDRITGAIALFGLLPHKVGFDDADRELLDLVACHGASVLDGSRKRAAKRWVR